MSAHGGVFDAAPSMSQCLLPAYLVTAIDVTTCRRRVELAVAVFSSGYSSILNYSTYHFKRRQPQVTDETRHAVNVTDMNRAVRTRQYAISAFSP